MYTIQTRVPVDKNNFDPMLGPWSDAWSDIGEGPFPTRADAQRFAKAEVGLPYRVVMVAEANVVEHFVKQALDSLQFLDELGGPDAREYVAIMHRIAADCEERAQRCFDNHLSAVNYWKDKGYYFEDVGGGHKALRKNIGGGLYILVTAADDCAAPVNVGDACVAGLYATANASDMDLCLAYIEDATSTALSKAIDAGQWTAGNP